MTIVHTIDEMRALAGPSRSFVPTLGALHEGHLFLLREAKKLADITVASVFVNPTQFAAGEDFEKYPRNLERDAELASQAGADLLFAPSVTEMFPRSGSKIVVPEVTELYEGAFRPGHFDAVATVVCKLLEIVQPKVAIFGLKDLQQCAVLQRMAQDLNLSVSLEFKPTVRESDGLALSSRNVYLTPEERSIAPMLYQQLLNSRASMLAGSGVEKVLISAHKDLSSVGFEVVYFDLVNITSFHPTQDVGEGTAIIAAARLGSTRLIDNVLLFDIENVS